MGNFSEEFKLLSDIVSGIVSGLTISIVVGIATWIRSCWRRRKAIIAISEFVSKIIDGMNQSISEQERFRFYREVRLYFSSWYNHKCEYLKSSEHTQLANAFYSINLKKASFAPMYIDGEDLSRFIHEIKKLDFLNLKIKANL